MASSAEKMRAWTGPALLSFGFRPFFLFGALWAALAMALWVALLAGVTALPIAFDPVSWHAHEFLFGYLAAVLAGFLLTAVPNWTGRLPVVGWPLAALVALWLAGRVAVALAALLPWEAVMAADLVFPLALVAVMAREIVAGRNWKNMAVLLLALAMTLANALFHIEAARGGFPAEGVGLRLGLAVAVLLIALIGGRIIPSFTRNWLAQRRSQTLPVPFSRGDSVVLALTLAVLAYWVAWPEHRAIPLAMGLAAVAHFWRLSRWAGRHTGAESLVWVLHAGYAFVPLGFAMVAVGQIWPGMASAALHVWTAGAIGLMTLAVMTRASLGHAGRPLHATTPITALYGALIVAVLARLAVGLWPGQGWLLHLAAAAWIAAFGGFAVLYWPILALPRSRGPKASGPARVGG